MRIDHFSGERVHGYLTFDVRFNPDITMLHGINGAGKTTAVRSMMALLNPDLTWLLTTEYDRIAVNFTHDLHKFAVESSRSSDKIELRVSGSHHRFVNAVVSTFSRRHLEYITDRARMSRRHAVTFSDELERYLPPDTDLEAVRAISEFPTPTFLGLERTTLPPDFSPEDDGSERPRRLGLYSRLNLEASISEALRLSKDAFDTRYRKAQSELMSRLRSRIILSLFQKANRDRINLPKRSDLQKYAEMERRITSVLRQLQLVNEHDLQQEVQPFFSELASLGAATLDAMTNKKISEKDRNAAIIKWIELEAPLSAIEKVVDLTQEYEADVVERFSPFQHYQDTLNAFFADSGKQLQFGETGSIEILLPNGERGDVGQLSSGERQLFVLLTHLAFNRKTKEADVLIIDEPELSLHLKWQQRFVDAISATSPSTQVILATHSPAIIGQYRKKCVSLNAKQRYSNL